MLRNVEHCVISVTQLGKLDRRDLRHMREITKIYTGFWWGNLTQRDCLEDVGLEGQVILK